MSFFHNPYLRDINPIILNYLDLNSAKNFRLTCTHSNNLFKKHWNHLVVVRKLDTFLKKRVLKDPVDDIIKLNYLRKISLKSNRKYVNDDILQYFQDVHTLNIQWCDKITDVGLQCLSNIHNLDLRGCHRITDAGLVHLQHVHTLTLYGCIEITDAGLVHLKTSRFSRSLSEIDKNVHT